MDALRGLETGATQNAEITLDRFSRARLKAEQTQRHAELVQAAVVRQLHLIRNVIHPVHLHRLRRADIGSKLNRLRGRSWHSRAIQHGDGLIVASRDQKPDTTRYCLQHQVERAARLKSVLQCFWTVPQEVWVVRLKGSKKTIARDRERGFRPRVNLGKLDLLPIAQPAIHLKRGRVGRDDESLRGHSAHTGGGFSSW